MGIYRSNGRVILATLCVKEMGAVGNGSTDDATAIQAALDALKTSGGIVYFPAGTYLITTPVLFYSNQTLLFEPGATILCGSGSMTSLMRNYSTTSIGEYDGTHDSQIIGATFDGGSYTTNITLLGFCHAQNILIKDCTFKNAYGKWHDLEINSSKYVKVENCNFSGSRKTEANGCNLQIDGAGNTSWYPWGDIKIDSTPSLFVEIVSCHFYENTVSPGIGNHSNSPHKYARVHDCTFYGNTGSRGAIHFDYGTHMLVYDCTFESCTTAMGGQYTAYNNLINGTLTA